MNTKNESFWQTGEIVTLVSSILLILGAFLPWVKSGLFGSVNGLQKDGLFTAGIGLLLIIILLCKKRSNILFFILGGISAVISFIDLYNAFNLLKVFEESIKDNMFSGLVQAQIGEGLYLTALASIGVIFGALLIKTKVNVTEEKDISKTQSKKSSLSKGEKKTIIVLTILFLLFTLVIVFNQSPQAKTIKPTIKPLIEQEDILVNKLTVKPTSVKSFQDYSVEVIGEITNTGKTFVKTYEARVVVSCYDENKKLVGTDSTFAEHPLNPGDTAPFKDYVDVSIRSSQIDYCSARMA